VYFKKLNIKIDIPDYEVGKKQLEYGINIDDKFNGLWYTVVNFYIETNNCATQFYEIKDNARPYQIENQTDGCIYNLDDLVETGSFIAEPGDVYILDVSKVHSVIPLDNTEINRKAICFSTNSLSFNQVEMMFT
jgi:hypothetical protein